MALYGNSCTCCLNGESVLKLYQDYTFVDKTENYGEMLKDCFGLLIISDNIHRIGICKTCINHLRHACDFKQQVLDCQERLRESVKNERKLESTCDDELGSGDRHIVMKLEPADGCDTDSNDDRVEDLVEEPVTVSAPKKTFKLNPIKKEKQPKKERNLTVTLKRKSKISSNGELKKYFAKTYVMKRNGKIEFLSNLNNFLKYSNCTPFAHKSIHGFMCAFCDDVCKTIQELRDHMNANHNNDTIKPSNNKHLQLKMDIANLKCNQCQKNANSLEELKSHLREHKVEMFDGTDSVPEFKFDNDKEFKCVVCSRTFGTYFTLLKHMNEHCKNFVCDECGTGFVTKYRLKAHLRLHDIGEYPCKLCNRIFETKIKRENHQRFHKKLKNTKCPHCDETFDAYEKRNKHMKDVHNDLPANYTCKMCDRQFLLGALLTAHVRKFHLMEKSHVCTECDKRFFKKNQLKRHMIKHTGEKKYKCKFCSKAYGAKSTLVGHERIHTNDRRFTCPICAVAFVQKCSMKGHMLSNHSMSLAEYELTKNTEENNDVDTPKIYD